MNGKKFVLLLAGACLFIVLLLPRTALHCEESTTKYKVIRLLSDAIDPPLATIEQGTVIIWANEDQETVEVQFNNNDMATSCNGAPLANIPAKQAIVFQIAFGGLESICLVQKGEFTYTVKRQSQVLTGKICIK